MAIEHGDILNIQLKMFEDLVYDSQICSFRLKQKFVFNVSEYSAWRWRRQQKRRLKKSSPKKHPRFNARILLKKRGCNILPQRDTLFAPYESQNILSDGLAFSV